MRLRQSRLFMRLRIFCVFLFSLAHCGAGPFGGTKRNSFLDDQNLLILLLIASAANQNPCNSIASPVLASAQPSGTLSGAPAAGNITGRLVTSSGASAVNQLVIVEDTTDVSNSAAVNFWSSHTSANRDGTFFIAGVPGGTTVKLSFEPISSTYYGRIDNHIDCFLTPTSFTAGWANGSSIVSTRGAGQTYTITTGSTLDAGTIRLN